MGLIGGISPSRVPAPHIAKVQKWSVATHTPPQKERQEGRLRSKSKSSNEMTGLRTIIFNRKASAKRSWCSRSRTSKGRPLWERAVHTLITRCLSLLSALRRLVCQLCHPRCFRARWSMESISLSFCPSNLIPFDLLYMWPLQWWLRTTGFSQRGNPFNMIKVTRRCLRALEMWKKPWFLSQGPVLAAPCRRKTLTTDASLTGWGAGMSGRSTQGLWEGPHLSWHINSL